ncbi:hypothetical protein KVV02_000612 [Mortierella alpina]|uniref:Uncharacterized protein n=1 Tax=Mortierella alpina TaxID=64518 RepID=A0A9P7ZZK1_MORAP|nr:hypothetical protein KVV02_000612 [Mortierella alpina]
MPSSTISRRLFVFDFDWTLIEADSDHWVIQQLGGDLVKNQEDLFGKMQWTDLQDMLLGQLFDRGVTKQDLENTLRQVPMMPEVIAALRLMKAQGAELCIISDANTFYIDTILKASSHRANAFSRPFFCFAYEIDQLFSKVITNPGQFDEQGRLHVSRFHGLDLEPHGCANPCQPNLCKGRELQKLIDAQSWDQIVYMGDSTNDFCPSTHLRPHDIVLARAELLLEKAIKAQPELIKANVTYWKSAQDVLQACNGIFNISSSKPILSTTATTRVSYSQLV